MLPYKCIVKMGKSNIRYSVFAVQPLSRLPPTVQRHVSFVAVSVLIGCSSDTCSSFIPLKAAMIIFTLQEQTQ